MEGISDDPELAQELLKLLHAKVRDARQELEDHSRVPKSEIALLDSTDLKQQNEVLRDELASLRLRLSAAAESEDTKEGFGSAALGLDEEHEQALALQERKTAADAEIERRKLQLKRNKAKYRQLRADVVGHEENLSALQASIKLEKEELEKCESHILNAEAELRALGPPAPVIQPFDIEAFMNAQIPQSGYPGSASLRSILQSTPLLELPEDILQQFGPMELLVPPPENIGWSQGRIDRAVFFAQAHRYDPTARGNSGAWEANHILADLMDGIARSRELFIRKGDNCYYYGTYRCVGSASLSLDACKGLTSATLPVRYAVISTAIHKDHLAPVALKFVDSMYDNGPLELQCFAFERVGFHHEFYDTLLSSIEAIQVINSSAALRGKTIASVVRRLRPQEGTNKDESSSATRRSGENVKKKQKRS